MENSILKDRIFWLISIFASIYILCNIGSGSLTTWDEAIYANVSKEILKTRNWLVLHHRGKPWFDKPPLYMWLTAIFYKTFGVNEFATRLTSGLFGVGCVLLVYIFAKKINNKNIAIYAALILLAMPHFLHFSKLGMMDVPIAFFISLIVYLFWIGQKKPHYLFLSGIILGLAYLMKGFAAFLGPIIILFYCLFSGNIRFLFKRQFLIGILFSLTIIFLWHLFQYLTAGPDSIKNYFGFHIFKRATQAVEFHSGGMNFYQKAIFNKNKPWSILAYLSVFYILWQAIKNKNEQSILLCCWIAATYVLYTAVKTKLHWYIMPIYPALAISSALFLSRFLKSKAYKFSLATILMIMLIQVPVSWAFKIDFCPDTKKVAKYAQTLYKNGSIIYFYGAYDNKEIFYLGDFVIFVSKENMPSKDIIASKKVCCIIRLDDIERARKEYHYFFEPIENFGNLVVTRIRDKD